ncbi:expressed unknown protein [Seminavis robusta]|uniref:WW domain-containing protein n=1 Tax=Seminavis robusta TaxID=568900 RepID=A0A9N8HVA7_9STRA|nr:expressed unknown protein [Seminavis robusta]|eukprot:Sro1770_g296540.1 n/a (702) ;mRNA; f:6564-8669
MASSTDDSNADEAEVWYAIPSKEHDQEYYHNPVTGESTWVLPSFEDHLLKKSEDDDCIESIRSDEIRNREREIEEDSGQNGSSDDDDSSISSHAERQKKRMPVIFCILFALLFVMFSSLSSSSNNDSPSDVVGKSKKHILSNNVHEEASYSSAADVTVDQETEDMANDTQIELVKMEQSADDVFLNDGSIEDYTASMIDATDVKHKAPAVTAEMQTEEVPSDEYNQDGKHSTQQADLSDTELEDSPDKILLGSQHQNVKEEGSDETKMGRSSHVDVNNVEQLVGSVNDDLVDAVNEACATETADAFTTHRFDESKIDTGPAGLEDERASQVTTNPETQEDKPSTSEVIPVHVTTVEGVEPDHDHIVDDTSVRGMEEECQHTSPHPEDAAKNSNDEEMSSVDETMVALEAEEYGTGGVQAMAPGVNDDSIVTNGKEGDAPTSDDNEPLEEASQETTMEAEASTEAIATDSITMEVVERSDLMEESLKHQVADLEEMASTVEDKNGAGALDHTMAEEAVDTISESIDEQTNQEMPGEPVAQDTLPESTDDQMSPVEDKTGESGVVDDTIVEFADDQMSTAKKEPASMEPIQLDWDAIRKATNIPARPDDDLSTGTTSYPVGVGQSMLVRLEIELDDVGYRIKKGTDSISLVEKEMMVRLPRPAKRGRGNDMWWNRVCRLPLGRKIIQKCQRTYPTMKVKAKQS